MSSTLGLYANPMQQIVGFLLSLPSKSLAVFSILSITHSVLDKFTFQLVQLTLHHFCVYLLKTKGQLQYNDRQIRARIQDITLDVCLLSLLVPKG